MAILEKNGKGFKLSFEDGKFEVFSSFSFIKEDGEAKLSFKTLSVSLDGVELEKGRYHFVGYDQKIFVLTMGNIFKILSKESDKQLIRDAFNKVDIEAKADAKKVSDELLNSDHFETRSNYNGKFTPVSRARENEFIKKAADFNEISEDDVHALLNHGKEVRYDTGFESVLRKVIVQNVMKKAWVMAEKAAKHHGKGTKKEYFAECLKMAHAGKDLVFEVFTIACDCGCRVEKSLIMSASFGTSCPDCYDRMSN